MRTISAVTVGRSDWGIYRPVLDAIRRDSDFRLHLIVASSHLVQNHGSTLSEIERDGFRPDDQVDMLLASDRPVSIATSMGLGTIGFSQILQ
ncbi:MAG TPA: UDP-N-acetylglucosamine 2-epimerase (hydrolyzing), partial [Planctomycetaceae bacterium]|nr:UDP-N-acetylglucosamine 2-epimerase (hydrolyzing) [Planctomycetaceae bacterium]